MSLIPVNFTDGVFTISADGGNSEALVLPNGDYSMSGLVPAGRAAEVYESQGAVVGHRKGARAKPTISVTGILHVPNAAFHQLAMGVIAGFASTTADIGDYPAVNFDWSCDLGAESRDIDGDDAYLTSWDISNGSPATVSFTFEVLGPVRIDGVTYVPAR